MHQKNYPSSEFEELQYLDGSARASDALGLVYTVHPNNSEYFFLKLSLYIVRGPTTFEGLRSVNGQYFLRRVK